MELWQIAHGHLEVVQWLFGAGAAEDVRTATNHGLTPMLMACESGHFEVAQWLFGAGAAEDVRTANKNGRTPMLVACANGHLEVAQWLFGAGAAEDVRTAHRDGITPMHWVWIEGNLEVVQWLICNGAATNTLTGHVDLSIMATFRNEIMKSRLPGLQSAMNMHLANQSNFIALILPAAYNSSAPCHLPRLRGLESSVVALIADYVGVVRGRNLRNLREARAFFW